MAPLPILRSLWLVLLVALALAPAQAANPLVKQGLTLSLNTSTYEVEAATDSSLGKTFSASAALINLSAQDIPFSFTDANSAAAHFGFRILNSAGTAVWESDQAVATTEVATSSTLESRSGWRRTLRIPIAPNGQSLAVGLYTLEARLAGTPALVATSLFSVVAPGSMGSTGIQGQVLRGGGFSLNLPTTTPTAEVGVSVSMEITEIRLPNARYDHPAFSWSGTTDSHGFYKVATPPGSFTVKVLNTGGIFYPVDTIQPATLLSTTLPPVGRPVPYGISTTVKVKAGKFTEQLFFIPGGPIIQPPTYTSGIKGHVTTAGSLVLLDGATPQQPMSIPVVGASVVITRSLIITLPPIITPPPIYTLTAADGLSLAPVTEYTIFLNPVWKGTTDADGRFKADLAPGFYQVQITAPGSGFLSRTIATRRVTVTANTYTPLEVVDSGLQFPSTDGVPIYSVNSLSISVQVNNQVTLVAKGQVTTGGWSNPRLVPRPSLSSSLLEFDFVADPPTGIATQVISPVQAETTISNAQNVKTIRVYSNSGYKEITP